MTQSTGIPNADTTPSTSVGRPVPPRTAGLFNRDSLLTIIGLSIPAALYVFGVSLPGERISKRIGNEIKAVQQTIQSIPLRVAKLNALQKTIHQRRASLRQTDRLIPRSPDLHTVIQETARFAKQARLTVTRLEPRELVDHATYRIQPFHVQLRGRFDSVVRFLHALETSPRLITIARCSLVRKDGTSGDDIDVDVDFEVYMNSADNSDSNDKHASSPVRQADTETVIVSLKG